MAERIREDEEGEEEGESDEEKEGEMEEERKEGPHPFIPKKFVFSTHTA